MPEWTIKESEYLLRHKYMTLRKDVCETKEGATVDPYFVLEFPAWVQTLPFDSDNNVLMTRQYRHGIQNVTYGLPTGFSEPSDGSVEESARRELLEETGYNSEKFVTIGELYPNPATQNNKVHCFAALDIQKVNDPADDPSERISLEFVSIEKLLSLIEDGSFSHALHVAGIYLTLRKLKLL